ncbi:unnamed protein product [Lepidochelys kempii]
MNACSGVKTYCQIKGLFKSVESFVSVSVSFRGPLGRIGVKPSFPFYLLLVNSLRQRNQKVCVSFLGISELVILVVVIRKALRNNRGRHRTYSLRRRLQDGRWKKS